MRGALLTVILGLALAACGGKTTTVTVTTSTQPPATASTPASSATATTATTLAPPVTSSTATSTTAASTTAASTTSASSTTSQAETVELTNFRSPTSNIGCVVDNIQLRCDIQQRSWSPPPRPASCPPVVDFGQGLIISSSGTGQFVCAGDTALDSQAPAVPYGDGAGVGPFVCHSSAIGFTCTDRDTGHGFFLSRQSYRLF